MQKQQSQQRRWIHILNPFDLKDCEDAGGLSREYVLRIPSVS